MRRAKAGRKPVSVSSPMMPKTLATIPVTIPWSRPLMPALAGPSLCRSHLSHLSGPAGKTEGFSNQPGCRPRQWRNGTALAGLGGGGVDAVPVGHGGLALVMGDAGGEERI